LSENDSGFSSSELSPGINSSLVRSIPWSIAFSSAVSIPNLVGGLLSLPSLVLYSAVVKFVVALLFAGGHGTGRLPSYTVFYMNG